MFCCLTYSLYTLPDGFEAVNTFFKIFLFHFFQIFLGPHFKIIAWKSVAYRNERRRSVYAFSNLEWEKIVSVHS